MAQRKSNHKTSFGKKTQAEKAFDKNRTKRRRLAEGGEKRPYAAPGYAAKHRTDQEGNPNKRRDAGRPYGGRSLKGGADSPRPFRKKDARDFSPGRRKFSDRTPGTKPFGKRTELDGSLEKVRQFNRSDFVKRPIGKTTSTEDPSQGNFRDSSTNRPYRKDQRETGRRKDRFGKGNDFAGRTRKETSSGPRAAGRGDKPLASRSWAKPGKPYSGFTRKTPVRKQSTSSVHKAVKKEDGLTRLNKYIANSGMGSRREADEMIKMGLISVNDKVITEMGFKVKEGDVVKHEGKILKAEQPVYVLLNKPKGFITTTVDPQERKTVMNLVASACKERIYPVGRLDRNTTGLLLLTNDGDLADKLTHPSYKAKKIYKVELDRPLTKNDFQKILEGVHLEEGKAVVDDLAYVDERKKEIGIELHIGWNRVVRRIFESLDYTVVKLDRVMYAGLDKKDIPRGSWRFLKPEEIVMLKHFK